MILPVLMAIVVLILAVMLMRRGASSRKVALRTEPMTDAQREAALLRLRQWLAADLPATAGAHDAG